MYLSYTFDWKNIFLCCSETIWGQITRYFWFEVWFISKQNACKFLAVKPFKLEHPWNILTIVTLLTPFKDSNLFHHRCLNFCWKKPISIFPLLSFRIRELVNIPSKSTIIIRSQFAHIVFSFWYWHFGISINPNLSIKVLQKFYNAFSCIINCSNRINLSFCFKKTSSSSFQVFFSRKLSAISCQGNKLTDTQWFYLEQ